MLKTKGMIATTAFVLLSAGFSAGVLADDAIKQVQAFLRPDVKVIVDGDPLELQDNPFLIYENTGYLPLRKLGEALNADIVWEGSTQTVYVNKRIYDHQPKPSDE